MYKSKIFHGSFGNLGGYTEKADDKFNEWIKEQPNIEIIEFKYMHSRYGDHSIAILYIDKTKEDE